MSLFAVCYFGHLLCLAMVIGRVLGQVTGRRQLHGFITLLTTPYVTAYPSITLLTFLIGGFSSSTPTLLRRTRSSISLIQATNPAQGLDGEVVVATALAGVAVVEEEGEEEEDLDGELDGWMMFEGRSVGAVVKLCDSP